MKRKHSINPVCLTLCALVAAATCDLHPFTAVGDNIGAAFTAEAISPGASVRRGAQSVMTSPTPSPAIQRPPSPSPPPSPPKPSPPPAPPRPPPPASPSPPAKPPPVRPPSPPTRPSPSPPFRPPRPPVPFPPSSPPPPPPPPPPSPPPSPPSSPPRRPPSPPPPPPSPAPPSPSSAPPAAATFEVLPFLAPVPAVSLANLPGTRRYLMFSKQPYNATKRLLGNNGGLIDLDTRQTWYFNPVYNHFCDGLNILEDGRVLLVGGHGPLLGLKNGLNVISYFEPANRSVVVLTNMVYGRWYPTVLRLPGGKVLISGGTQKVNAGPVAPTSELFDPLRPAAGTANVTEPSNFVAAATQFGLKLYPLMQLLPNGEILWWSDRGGSITDANFNLVVDLPSLPNSFPYRTEYRNSATLTPLALQPDSSGRYNNFSIAIFGGSMRLAGFTTPASPLSARLDLWYCGTTICNGGWVIESMLNASRTMPDSILLPNGKVLVHGGAQAGVAGSPVNTVHVSNNPAAVSLMYDPLAPLAQRFAFTESIAVARLYHSTACLDVSGKVLSAGCESCNVTMPAGFTVSSTGDEELRLTLGTPYEISAAVTRPVIRSSPQTITRGGTFTVSYTYGGGRITGASLAAPCAVTHSINMNQRVIFLVVDSDASGVLTLRAPPASQPAVALPGHYMLFLLGDRTPTGTTYSEGVWVRLLEAAASG